MGVILQRNQEYHYCCYLLRQKCSVPQGVYEDCTYGSASHQSLYDFLPFYIWFCTSLSSGLLSGLVLVICVSFLLPCYIPCQCKHPLVISSYSLIGGLHHFYFQILPLQVEFFVDCTCLIIQLSQLRSYQHFSFVLLHLLRPWLGL